MHEHFQFFGLTNKKLKNKHTDGVINEIHYIILSTLAHTTSNGQISEFPPIQHG